MINLQYKMLDNTLFVILNERIDSNNVQMVEEEIMNILDNNPHDALVLDAENLEYISSAGLRVILRIRKKEANMEIHHASVDVYDIFDMTGFTEMITITKAYRKLSVDGCKVIGEGAKGTVYRYNPEIVVKVYKNPDSITEIKNERELAKKAFVLGIPTAISYDIVKVGDKFGSVFELLDCKSLTELLRENKDNLSEYAKMSADLLNQINNTAVKEKDFIDFKESVYKKIKFLPKILSNEYVEKIKSLVDNVPCDLCMIHGDYHTNNIMYQNNEVILIDMDTLARGNKVFELANVYISYVGFGIFEKSMVENFMGLDYATCCAFWDKFIAYYLGTTDIDRINEVTNKVKLLSLIRYFYHLNKRDELTSEKMAYFKEHIEKLVDIVDNLAL